MKKIILKIDGMTCSACSNGLEKYLNKQDGINNASVNLIMNSARIEYDEKKVDIKKIERFIENAGFKSLGKYKLENDNKKNNAEKVKLLLIILLSLLIMYISMSHMVQFIQIPFLAIEKHQLNYALSQCVLTIIVILLAKDIINNGIKNFLHRTPNMDTLVTIGVFSSFIYSLYGTYMIFNGTLDYVTKLYYESASMVILFIKIGKFIEGKNKDKTKQAIQKLMTITPKNACIIKDEKEFKITIDEIQKNDIVVCKPGEKIAVDGVVIEGVTHIDKSFITGESKPIKVENGSKVLAGSINYEGTIKYKAEKIGKNSTVSEIVKMVIESNNTKAPISKITDKISSFFIPFIIILAVVLFIIWYIITKNIGFSINIFVSVLVIACPCSLGLATPLAIVISSGLCSKRGILVKSSDVLENAHKIKTICFDKTGTLTKGMLCISKIYQYDDSRLNELMVCVASIEKNSEHPIGSAFVKYVEEKKLKLKKISYFNSIPGHGVYAKINEDEYYIGNRKLMEENKIRIVNKSDEIDLTEKGNSIVYVSKNNKLIALIGVKDLIRDNIKDVITELKEKNINIIMLTGDNEKTAKFIADEVGIENIVSNANPQEKAKKIKELKKYGPVLMCGDGINDSVSLVTADIGVAISNGTDIAIDSANVVIMNDSLGKINELIYISEKTLRNIKQNLFFAFFYNICMIPIAAGLFIRFGFTLNPMIAALCMTLSSLTVVFNALRLTKMKIYNI